VLNTPNGFSTRHGLIAVFIVIAGIRSGHYYLVAFLLLVPTLVLGIWRRFVFKELPTKERKWPIQLSSHACDIFEVFPGVPEGYSAYTDSVAMNVDVNDDLAARLHAEQYALLGFGSGFLRGLKRRLPDEYQAQTIAVRIQNASLKHQQFLGWISYLQRSGVDNAPPSTENLRRTLESISADVLVNGPICGTFWEKAHCRDQTKLHTIRIDLEGLEELKEEYQKASAQGENHALEAVIVTRDPSPA
jgi:hypothetical protein